MFRKELMRRSDPISFFRLEGLSRAGDIRSDSGRAREDQDLERRWGLSFSFSLEDAVSVLDAKEVVGNLRGFVSVREVIHARNTSLHLDSETLQAAGAHG
jgi:hypothetical protein